MPDPLIFTVGLVTSALCIGFFVFSFRELRAAGRESERRYGKRERDDG